MGARRRGQDLVEPKDIIVVDARVADGIQGAKDSLEGSATVDQANVFGRNASRQSPLDSWADLRKAAIRMPLAVGNDVVERGWIGKRIDDLSPEMLNQILSRRHERLPSGLTPELSRAAKRLRLE